MGNLKPIHSETQQDLELARRVLQDLSGLQIPIFRKLSITADQGTVTVRGTVCSFYKRQIAISSIRQVTGVTKLNDEITVDGIA